MQAYFLRNLSELAERRAINMRQEAQLWDILGRDLKREAGRREEEPVKRLKLDFLPEQITKLPKVEESKMFVRIPEAARLMGMGRSSIYKEISLGNLKVRKSGRKTLIAVADIYAWFSKLPEGTSL